MGIHEKKGETYTVTQPRGHRTSHRQAILVLAVAPSSAMVSAFGNTAAQALMQHAMLDTIGTLVRIDGATLSVVCADAVQAGTLASVLPAGLDIMVPPESDATGRDGLGWALRTHLDRAFERVVAVTADVMGMLARSTATALSALEGADLVVGPTQRGGIWLVGVCSYHTIGLVSGNAVSEPRAANALLDRTRAAGYVARRVESYPRLGELDGADEMIQAAAGAAPHTFRLGTALARHVGDG